MMGRTFGWMASAALLGLAGLVGTGTVSGAADAAPGCGNGAPERAFSVSAINLRMQLNRFGDHDPTAYMYVRDDEIDAVRAQERGEQVSLGLGDDAIQPLVLRGNLGDCIVVRFTNRTAGRDGKAAPRVGMQALGLPYDAAQSGDAVGMNGGDPAAVAAGSSVTYRFFLDPATGEGAHVIHTLGDARQLTAHGLFGAIIAEPEGSRHLDPRTGEEGDIGTWEAIIDPPQSPAFREFALQYHEIGDEAFVLTGGNGRKVQMNDCANDACMDNAFGPHSGAYRPGSRAINYRSEPFMNRMLLENPAVVPSPAPYRPSTDHPLDKSALYSTYAYGDPPTPLGRSYLGEPTKTRLINAGSEMAHVHHLHGGGTRWRRSPGADDTDLSGGLRKTPNQDAKSIRLDSQTVSPGETFSLEHECGAGGCQQVAGDFLLHCHIAQHYVAGMWAMWRVYDTRQRDLAPLPDREAPPEAVTSDKLAGTEIEGKTLVPEAELRDPEHERSLEAFVEAQLPPQGTRTAWDDATVWDWEKQGSAQAPRYVGEPEDTRTWVNFASDQPGERPEILFNPVNGRYAWPLLRPHLATRPPFSPKAHSGTPWLGDTGSAARPDGLCPAGAPVRRFDITAITRDIQVTDTTSDKAGQIFVLNEDRAAVLAGTKAPEPLVIRANVGECLELTLSSQLADAKENHDYSKVNIHTHLVQFDPQGSDGVVTGNAFEQSVRPFPTEDRVLAATAEQGDRVVRVTRAEGLRPGVAIAVGQGEPTIETATVTRVEDDGTVTLDAPLTRDHEAGEATGVEFVRYRWYADVETGTVFYHDHVDGINSWDHGLFGGLVVEPKGSTYHDPKTGEELRSGAIADIRTTGSVGAGQQGSFREFLCILHDGLRNDKNTGSLPNGQIFRQGGSINLRAEPLSERGQASVRPTASSGGAAAKPEGHRTQPDDPHPFSSVRWGDPFTPIPRAYAGDPMVVRTLGVTELEGSLRLPGHRFRTERFAADSELTDAGTAGISERFDYVLDGGAGGPGKRPGDYLYLSAAASATKAGAWGLLRVHDTRRDDLQPLPGRTPPDGDGFPRLTPTGKAPPEASSPGQPCPDDAPTRRYEVAVFAKPLPLKTDPQPINFVFVPAAPGIPVPAAKAVTQDKDGVVFSLAEDRQAILDGRKPLEPLVLRANAGDCVEIVLESHLPEGTRAGFNVAKLLADPQGSSGAAIGLNPDSTVGSGAHRTYRLYADRELGTSIALDLNAPNRQTHGAFGAVIVEPNGSTWVDPATGKPLASGSRAEVRTPQGTFQEATALMHDDEQQIGDNDGRYPTEVGGFAGLNYQAERFEDRQQGIVEQAWENLAPKVPKRITPRVRGTVPDRAEVFSSTVYGDPKTPVPVVRSGQALRLRVAVPAADQFHSFWLAGHTWDWDPALEGSQRRDAETVGPGQSIDAHTRAGAPGDYLFGDHRFPFTEAGMWGLLRVRPAVSENG